MWKLPAIIFFTVLTSWFGAKRQRSDLEDMRQVILDVDERDVSSGHSHLSLISEKARIARSKLSP